MSKWLLKEEYGTTVLDPKERTVSIWTPKYTDNELKCVETSWYETYLIGFERSILSVQIILYTNIRETLFWFSHIKTILFHCLEKKKRNGRKTTTLFYASSTKTTSTMQSTYANERIDATFSTALTSYQYRLHWLIYTIKGTKKNKKKK